MSDDGGKYWLIQTLLGRHIWPLIHHSWKLHLFTRGLWTHNDQTIIKLLSLLQCSTWCRQRDGDFFYHKPRAAEIATRKKSEEPFFMYYYFILLFYTCHLPTAPLLFFHTVSGANEERGIIEYHEPRAAEIETR